MRREGSKGGGTEQVSSASEIITKIARIADVVNFQVTMVFKESSGGVRMMMRGGKRGEILKR